MTRNPTRFLIPALLAAALATSAAAAPDGVVMELDLMTQGDNTVAVVILDHAMGLPLELDLTYNINGSILKTEPFEVLGRTAYVEVLGPADQYYSVCASIDGLIRINGDNTRPTAGVRCDIEFPAPTMSPLMGEFASRSFELPLPGSRAVEAPNRQGRTLSTLERR